MTKSIINATSVLNFSVNRLAPLCTYVCDGHPSQLFATFRPRYLAVAVW
jgi:hypothetical protein